MFMLKTVDSIDHEYNQNVFALNSCQGHFSVNPLNLQLYAALLLGHSIVKT
jgi:hypothetical protein